MDTDLYSIAIIIMVAVSLYLGILGIFEFDILRLLEKISPIAIKRPLYILAGLSGLYVAYQYNLLGAK